uniref:Xylulose kinase-1 n=1 Tax=Tanacetum cinerariifolium TaxID=118510 RepID=A0A6L2J0B4_TANCI|nr:hypothetical protein [Tanacetum cinerariifolium]
MVAYLEKSKGSEGFHQIIDFLSASHITHALTESPTIYASLIKQFWQTAALSIIEDGFIAITATIDRNVKVLITEASIRRHIKIGDSKGLSTLPTEESFEQLARMGNMKRFSKGYSGVITSLFDTMLVQHPHGEPSTLASSPSRITSSPSLSPQHTSINAPSTSQQPNIQTIPVVKETTPMPYDSPLQSTKKVYSSALTKVILRVKKLERTVKTSKARRKARIVILEDKDAEDPSKQGRSLIEELDMVVDISLVPPYAGDQGRKSDDTQVSGQPKEQLGVFSAAKVLADAFKQGRGDENDQTYTRQRRRVNTASTLVSTAGVSTASEMVSTADLKENDKAQKLHEEELERFNAEQEAIDTTRQEKVVAKVQEVERQSTKEEKGKKSDDSSKPTRKKTLARKRAVIEDEFVMEVESLVTKYLIIDWKTHVLIEDFMYYQIIRADGSSKNYKIFSEMLDDFDRQDVMDLHRLVEERYTTTSPEGYDLMLWGNLKTLFESDKQNKLWKNQHEYNLISWRLCDSNGIHISLMDNGIAIHMLIEKKYPLGQEMISKMLSKRLEVNQESEMAFELLRIAMKKCIYKLCHKVPFIDQEKP